ncbi:hypothetical protein L9F63_023676, partial [Diploptera punctata]
LKQCTMLPPIEVLRKQDFRTVGRGLEACSSPTFRQRLCPASSRVVLGLEACSSPTFRQRLRPASSRVVLEDAGR